MAWPPPALAADRASPWCWSTSLTSLDAAFWGTVSGSALLVGAAIGLYVRVSQRVLASIVSFGAGALISVVAFDLMDEAFKRAGLWAPAVGLAAGALTFFIADIFLAARGAAGRKRSKGQSSDEGGLAVFIGSMLDNVPESMAIGIGLLSGQGVGVALVAGVFLSNLPEALAGTAGMVKAGRSTGYVFGLWGAATAATTVSAWAGFALLANALPSTIGAIQGFAGGAILAMLASTMMPEAFEEGGPLVGLTTAMGFLAAFMLDKLA